MKMGYWPPKLRYNQHAKQSIIRRNYLNASLMFQIRVQVLLKWCDTKLET